jgi:regulator of sigma E protease
MLAVLNILPVPVLDGGHLIYLAAEKIRGRPLSEATMAKMQWVGLLLLLTLMFFAIKNDILFLGK